MFNGAVLDDRRARFKVKPEDDMFLIVREKLSPIVREYVFYVYFSKFKKMPFVFKKMTCQKT